MERAQARGHLSVLRAELTAFIEAVALVMQRYPDHPITLYTDSEYVVKMITEWGPQWIKKGITQKKANPDLVLQALALSSMLHMKPTSDKMPFLQLIHVYGHGKSDDFETKYNNLADQLANVALDNKYNTFINQFNSLSVDNF